jgi:hypothetical protein
MLNKLLIGYLLMHMLISFTMIIVLFLPNANAYFRSCSKKEKNEEQN